MKNLSPTALENWYKVYLNKNLNGRYILYKDIEPCLSVLSPLFKKQIIGYSENEIPIHKLTIGTGKKSILLWSQMHGNESTGTKALFDLFNFFKNPTSRFQGIVTEILKNCTIHFIPLLNPDGAIKFTRENANNIDLNRDAVSKKAVESKLLRKELDAINPKFCFNLHDQRSIFNVSGTKNPATLSFLAPSEDIDRTLTVGRIETMSVIVAMNSFLQQIIPNSIGRYTDEFYPTATGDNFQKLGHNTILIEAGHYMQDYNRELTRKFNFFALIEGLRFIAMSTDFSNYKPYFEIPNNDNNFLDKIYKNILIEEDGKITRTDIGIQYKFKVINNKLIKYEYVEKMGDLSSYCTLNLINAEKLNISDLQLSNS